jgi:sugar/nucleoside kinase (ribokinase family)
MQSETQSRGLRVAGVGLNATDTVIRLPHFPTLDSKVEVISSEVKAGGQVASAMVACHRWGLQARYVGKIGDDAAGRFQAEEMAREGVEAHWVVAHGCSSQSAFILVDEQSGERTVLWKRDPAISLQPQDVLPECVTDCSALLIDGHDTAAATQAAQWARVEKIPVVGDFDNLYLGIQALLEFVDYPITSKEFPERLTGDNDLLKSLPIIQSRFKSRLVGATLGRLGALAWDGSNFLLCPGFRVKAVDTTGAGDIFHGAFVFGLVHGWSVKEMLEFGCAAAAINCEAPGARGKIGTLEMIQDLRKTGERSELAYTPQQILEASRAAREETATEDESRRGPAEKFK